MNVHLVVPELFPDPERGDAELSSARAAALELLLARGRSKSVAGVGLETWLLDAFAVAKQTDWPAAPYSLIADGGQPGGAWWLRADPVTLRADQQTVLLSDAVLADVSHEEAVALTASLNAHFEAVGLSFHPLQPSRWYARVDSDPEMTAVPTAEVRGRPVIESLPAGPQGGRWRAILNEIQMVLHEHPINAAREARGAATVNGLWLWGAGRLADPPRSAYQRVTSDSPIATGLTLAAGKRHARLPASGREWLERSGRSGVEAVVLDALREATAHGDKSAWRNSLATLERDWFAPLLDALRAGRIGMITLWAPAAMHTLESETTRQDLRRFWRTRRPLAAYAV